MVMSKFAPAALLLAFAVAQPAFAEGKTPTGDWLPVIKDAIRTELKNPVYVTFRRIFFVDKKTDSGAVPVCGFANFKQKKEQHAATKAFFGLLVPPGVGQKGSFASIQMGDEKDQGIAKTCKDYGIY